MLIPVSNWELDSVPVVTRRGRKGEMCVGREKKHRKHAVKDSSVKLAQGSVPVRVWRWPVGWSSAGRLLPSMCLRTPDHATATIAQIPSQPTLVAHSEDLQPAHSAHQTIPPPQLLKYLPDPLRWLTVRTSSQATLHHQPIQLTQARQGPKITALKQTWHNYNWVYFQRLKLPISLLWALLCLCRVCFGWVNGYSYIWDDKLSLGLSFV